MIDTKSYISLQRAGYFWAILAFNFAILFLLFANIPGGTNAATCCIASLLLCKCLASDLLIWSNEIFNGEFEDF